jgi:hypothetical protein
MLEDTPSWQAPESGSGDVPQEDAA